MSRQHRQKFMRTRRCKVFLDEVQIHHVWYFDGRRKVLKSYDVRGDGGGAWAPRGKEREEFLAKHPDCELLPSGVLSRTLRGRRIRTARIW
jgi:aspartate oxidase